MSSSTPPERRRGRRESSIPLGLALGLAGLVIAVLLFLAWLAAQILGLGG
jgi:hypothetical protein